MMHLKQAPKKCVNNYIIRNVVIYLGTYSAYVTISMNKETKNNEQKQGKYSLLIELCPFNSIDSSIRIIIELNVMALGLCVILHYKC